MKRRIFALAVVLVLLVAALLGCEVGQQPRMVRVPGYRIFQQQ